MKNIFVETSIFIRFFTRDDEVRYKDSSLLMKLIEEGRLKPYSSNIVLLEIVFVLTKIYEFPKRKVLNVINDIYKMRNLVLIEKTDTVSAISFFKEHGIKFSDCLIATQIPKGVYLVTYDEEFSKVIPKIVIQPGRIVGEMGEEGL